MSSSNKNQMGSKVSSALEVGLLMALMCARASENVTFLRYGNSKVVTKSVDYFTYNLFVPPSYITPDLAKWNAYLMI